MAHLERYLILVVAFIGITQLSAQPAPASGEIAARRVVVVALADPGADYAGLFVMNGSQPFPLVVKLGGRSEPFDLGRGAKDLVLARQGTDPATGKPTYLPVASSPWPGAKTRDALWIIGASAGVKEFKSLALDDGLSVFPSETVQLVNLTGIPLLAKVNTFRGEVKHGASIQAIPYPDMKKLPPNTLARYPFALAAQSPGGEILKLSSGFLEAVPGTRSLVIVQSPLEAGSKKVRVKTILDYPPPPVPIPAQIR